MDCAGSDGTNTCLDTHYSLGVSFTTAKYQHIMILNIVVIQLLSSIVQSGIVDHQSQVKSLHIDQFVSTVNFQRILSGKTLSDKVRHEDEGDYEYDHDAFLGEDQAEYFDTLTPDESQRRLGLICDRIDIDGDGNISQEELRR